MFFGTKPKGSTADINKKLRHQWPAEKQEDLNPLGKLRQAYSRVMAGGTEDVRESAAHTIHVGTVAVDNVSGRFRR